jgi:hypothetical protein
MFIGIVDNQFYSVSAIPNWIYSRCRIILAIILKIIKAINARDLQISEIIALDRKDSP